MTPLLVLIVAVLAGLFVLLWSPLAFVAIAILVAAVLLILRGSREGPAI